MATPAAPRRLRLTRKQWVGLPVLLGVPIVAATGALGDNRAGIVARMILVYVFVLLCFRVLGKRELSQMSPFEIVTLFLVPQLFRNALLRNDNTMGTAVVGALTLFALVLLTSLFRYRFEPFERVVQAHPTVLVHDGTLAHADMQRERITADDVLSAMRLVGVDRFEDVRLAVLEADGSISIVPTGPSSVSHHAPAR